MTDLPNPGEFETFTARLMVKAQEEADEFIFQTIRPFCEDATQFFVSKNDLKAALIMYYGNQKPEEPIHSDYGDSCPKCGNSIIRYPPPDGIESSFCPFCGKAVKWDA